MHVKRRSVQAKKAPTGFVVNATRGTIFAQDGTILRSALRQAVGMMLHRKPTCYVFVFPWTSRIAITNVFVFHDLDLLWLDKQGVVVDIREQFPSWALHAAPAHKAKLVVEAPAGAVRASKTRVGDQLMIRGL